MNQQKTDKDAESTEVSKPEVSFRGRVGVLMTIRGYKGTRRMPCRVCGVRGSDLLMDEAVEADVRTSCPAVLTYLTGVLFQ